MIIVDSREKKWNHIEKQFIRHKVAYKVQKLDTGDYIRSEDGNTIIDRKHGLEEVASNLAPDKRKNGVSEHKHRDRFVDELKRAKTDKVRFIVLIENSHCHSPKDVASYGKMEHSRITGTMLVEQMIRLEFAYKVEWMFCESKDSWKVICDLLGEPYEHK